MDSTKALTIAVAAVAVLLIPQAIQSLQFSTCVHESYQESQGGIGRWKTADSVRWCNGGG